VQECWPIPKDPSISIWYIGINVPDVRLFTAVPSGWSFLISMGDILAVAEERAWTEERSGREAVSRKD
jgi:hypothetical protein